MPRYDMFVSERIMPHCDMFVSERESCHIVICL